MNPRKHEIRSLRGKKVAVAHIYTDTETGEIVFEVEIDNGKHENDTLCLTATAQVHVTALVLKGDDLDRGPEKHYHASYGNA